MKLTKEQLSAIFELAEGFGLEKTAEILCIDIKKLESKDPELYTLFVDTWTQGRVQTLQYFMRRIKDASNDPSTRLNASLAYLSKFALEPDTWSSTDKNLAGGKRIKIELSP